MVPGRAVEGQGVECRRRRSGGEPCWIAGGDGEEDFRQGCGVVAGVVERRRRQERKKEGEKMRRMESRGRGRVLGGTGVSDSYVSCVPTPASLPHFCLLFTEEITSGPPRGRYRPVLDGSRGPGGWTVCGPALEMC